MTNDTAAGGHTATTNSTTDQPTLAVTQADREAAANLVVPHGRWPGFPADFRSGRADSNELTQAFARHRTNSEPRPAGDLREARDTAESLVEAWASVCEGLEAHLQDRVAMHDEANPAAYLSILRGSMANVQRFSEQVRASRWADYARQNDRIAELEARLATHSPAPMAGNDVDAMAVEYAGEYVMSTEGADYEPTQWERALILDALHGFIADHRLAAHPSTQEG